MFPVSKSSPFLSQIKPKGAVCRDQINDCDLPEFCTGKSELVGITRLLPLPEVLENSLIYKAPSRTLKIPLKIFRLAGFYPSLEKPWDFKIMTGECNMI